MNIILETDRLVLRPIILEDNKDIFAYRSNPEISKYQSWVPETVSDVDSFIENVSKRINEPETWFQFVILEKETKELIGDIGIHFLDDENKQVEIGCTLSHNFQKLGYATESLKRIIDYLFNELNKHRIITSIDPKNTNSIRLVERIGFRKEAHFVESLLINGTWVDDIIYALLEKDWKRLNTQ